MCVALDTAAENLHHLHRLIVINLYLGKQARHRESFTFSRIIDALVLILGVEHDLLAAVVQVVAPTHNAAVAHRA